MNSIPPTFKARKNRYDAQPRFGIGYDETILMRYGESLYTRANWIIARWTITIGGLGLLLGYLPVAIWYLTPSSARTPQTGGLMVVLGIIGAMVGWAIGESKAFQYRLVAQLVFCLAQIERNTRPAGTN